MRSRGWRQGRGRRAETVYLKPKKKASGRPAQPAPPPPHFSLSSAPCLPLGLTRVLPPSPGPGTHGPASGPLSQTCFQRGHWSGRAAAHWPQGDGLSLPQPLSGGACGQAPRSLQRPSPGSSVELEGGQRWGCLAGGQAPKQQTASLSSSAT